MTATQSQPHAAADAQRYQELCARAAGSNVNDVSLLATDYLNHINEVIMLLEIVPDAPECLEDCKAWQPLEYTEHFKNSGIADDQAARLDPVVFAGRHEVAAGQQLHAEEQATVGQLAEVEDLDDVLRAGAGRRLRLVAEHLRRVAALAQLRAQDLQRHPPLDVDVLGLVDHPHPALAQPAQQAVAGPGDRLAGDQADVRPRLRRTLEPALTPDPGRAHLRPEVRRGRRVVAGLRPPQFPEILGVIYCDPAPSYEAQVAAQNAQARAKGPGDLDKLMRAGNTWSVT